MKKNLNTPDRVIRIIASLVVLFFVVNGTITGTIGTVLAVVAIVLIATGVISFCPLYAALGISTRRKEESKVAVQSH